MYNNMGYWPSTRSRWLDMVCLWTTISRVKVHKSISSCLDLTSSVNKGFTILQKNAVFLQGTLCNIRQARWQNFARLGSQSQCSIQFILSAHWARHINDKKQLTVGVMGMQHSSSPEKIFQWSSNFIGHFNKHDLEDMENLENSHCNLNFWEILSRIFKIFWTNTLKEVARIFNWLACHGYRGPLKNQSTACSVAFFTVILTHAYMYETFSSNQLLIFF